MRSHPDTHQPRPRGVAALPARPTGCSRWHPSAAVAEQSGRPHPAQAAAGALVGDEHTRRHRTGRHGPHAQCRELAVEPDCASPSRRSGRPGGRRDPATRIRAADLGLDGLGRFHDLDGLVLRLGLAGLEQATVVGLERPSSCGRPRFRREPGRSRPPLFPTRAASSSSAFSRFDQLAEPTPGGLGPSVRGVAGRDGPRPRPPPAGGDHVDAGPDRPGCPASSARRSGCRAIPRREPAASSGADRLSRRAPAPPPTSPVPHPPVPSRYRYRRQHRCHRIVAAPCTVVTSTDPPPVPMARSSQTRSRFRTLGAGVRRNESWNADRHRVEDFDVELVDSTSRRSLPGPSSQATGLWPWGACRPRGSRAPGRPSRTSDMNACMDLSWTRTWRQPCTLPPFMWVLTAAGLPIHTAVDSRGEPDEPHVGVPAALDPVVPVLPGRRSPLGKGPGGRGAAGDDLSMPTIPRPDGRRRRG